MPSGPVNRHRGLGDRELPWRYLRRHDRVEVEEHDPSDQLFVDEYWDPWNETSALDFQLHRGWQDIVNLGYATPFASLVPGANVNATPPVPAVEHAAMPADQLADSLYAHLEQVTRGVVELRGPLDEVRSVGRRAPELLRWFEHRRGPAVMLLVLEPFWIRSLKSWRPPAVDDIEATARSLVEHLLVRYPVPEPLYRPWRSSDVPPVKWAAWLVLIGQGASLKRAGTRFGWNVSPKLLQNLASITENIEPTEAVMSAEITSLGGSGVELQRVRRHPGFVVDPTSSTELELAIDEANQPPQYRRSSAAAEAFGRFWRSTIQWLARNRDELTDETCDLILDWGLHRHIEACARDHDPFSWSGRTVASALEQAGDYRVRIGNTWAARAVPLFWSDRGWGWVQIVDDVPWSVRELTSSAQLAEESLAMQHCVASYAYRCVQGLSAIFSVCRDGERRFTVELDPKTRRLVQARGARNRRCDDAELAFVRWWLAQTVDPRR